MDKNAGPKAIIERMKIAAKVKTHAELGVVLGGISSQAISDAIKKKRIPDNWYTRIEEATGMTQAALERPIGTVLQLGDHSHAVGYGSVVIDSQNNNQNILTDLAETPAENIAINLLLGHFHLITRFLKERHGLNQATPAIFLASFLDSYPGFSEWVNSLDNDPPVIQKD